MTRNILRVESFQPTIGSAFHAAEGYLEYLHSASGASTALPPLPVLPLDALLIHLLAAIQPARPYAADLAAASTWGVSTVLCRTDPAMRQVVAPEDNSKENWQRILDRYLDDQSAGLVEHIQVAGRREVHRPHRQSSCACPGDRSRGGCGEPEFGRGIRELAGRGTAGRDCTVRRGQSRRIFVPYVADCWLHRHSVSLGTAARAGAGVGRKPTCSLGTTQQRRF